MLGGILIVLIGALTFWVRGGRYVSADDAYVRAAKLMVSTDVSGIVTDVDVREGQAVKAGDVLFRIDPRQFRIALDNAKAQLQQTALVIEAMKQDYKRMLEDIKAHQAQVELDQANYERYAVLVKSDSISKANYDQARFTLAADKRKLESLKQQAAVQLARLDGNPDIPVTEPVATMPVLVFDLEELAQVLKISTWSARRLIDAGAIPALNFPVVGHGAGRRAPDSKMKRVLVRVVDVEKFLEARSRR